MNWLRQLTHFIKPAIDHLQYAKKLVKKVKYLPDSNTSMIEWTDDELLYP